MLEAKEVQPAAGVTLGLPARTKHWTSTKVALLTVSPPPGSVTLADTPSYPTSVRVAVPNKLICVAVGLAVGVVAKVAVGLPVGSELGVGTSVKVGEAIGVRVAAVVVVGFAVGVANGLGDGDGLLLGLKLGEGVRAGVGDSAGLKLGEELGVTVGAVAEASATTIPEFKSSAAEQVMLCAASVPCVPCPRAATA